MKEIKSKKVEATAPLEKVKDREIDATRELNNFILELSKKYDLSLFEILGILTAYTYDLVYTWNRLTEGMALVDLKKILEEALKKVTEEEIKKLGIGE